MGRFDHNYFGLFFSRPSARISLLFTHFLARRRREKWDFQVVFPSENRIFFGRAYGALSILNTIGKSAFSPPQAQKK